MKKTMLKILAWLFPNKCLICGEYIDAQSFVCKKCDETQMLKKNFNVKFKSTSKNLQVFSNYFYKDDYAYFIKRFKFKGKTSYARKFMGLTKQMLGDFPFEKYDKICYVPMTKEKVKQRGYNQSKLLAKKLSKLTNLPVSDCLVKIKSNKIQHWLSFDERRKNVKGVYSCQDDLIGQNIILIDDIITTGATVCQCAKMLFTANANHVIVLCLAETPDNN